MKAKEYSQALDHFQKASEYPENLSVGRPKNDPRAPQVAYHIGMAYEALGESEKATQFYRQTADQTGTSSWPEARFYQALCLSKLGEKEGALTILDRLVETGRKGLGEEESSDFFAKFGEQETKQARKASAHFTLALGLLGKSQIQEAKAELEQAVNLNQSHLWAKYLLSTL